LRSDGQSPGLAPVPIGPLRRSIDGLVRSVSSFVAEVRDEGRASERGTTGLKRLVVEVSHTPTSPMTESDQPTAPDRLLELLDEADYAEAVAGLDRLAGADADVRKRALRAVRDVVEERPGAFETLGAPLSTFLTDEKRAVRLTTAKLFVTLARSNPEAVLPAVDALAARLADDEEFYYVRARCAEALGYAAVESPPAVTDPETLADLRIGLSFDEPEVKEKLAKALTYVAIGDPSRLRHQVASLAEHLDDENELVRYHLCTTLVVVGCAYPAKLVEAAEPLRERLADANPYVRGRAAEAFGLLAASEADVGTVPDLDGIEGEDEDPPTFVTDRVAFCRRRLGTDQSEETPDGVGTVESIRDGTDEVVEEMTTSGDGVCPNCGLGLPEGGPPMCPRCGTPRR
jgi:HEAT repeat protein